MADRNLEVEKDIGVWVPDRVRVGFSPEEPFVMIAFMGPDRDDPGETYALTPEAALHVANDIINALHDLDAFAKRPVQ